MLVYFHIPFCHRICPYCSFYKHTPGGTPIAEFIDALRTEAATRVAASPAPPRTLYFGGGTPSMLSPAHLTRLFEGLHTCIDFAAVEEITLEANPATFDLAKARLLRKLGVTRVSLGIQSFSPHVLATLGREHSPKQAADSVHTLREAEMPSVNIDLMFSIPSQSRDDWADTLERTISLQPDHVSAYNLTYEEDTAFFESLRRGEMSQNEDIDASFFHLAEKTLTAAGFDHYETSNYARPGHHSRHNQGYWQGADYLGLGPSAVSTVAATRTRNVPDTARYVEMIRFIGNAITESEPLEAEARRIERIALGLRTTAGIPLDWLDAGARVRAGHLAEEGLARIDGPRLVLIQRGRALVDPIAADLI